VRSRCGFDSLVPSACTINAHRKSGVSSTIFELASVVVGRDVPEAAHDIVDVVAKAGSTSPNAGTEAELVVRDEAGPFMVLETLTEAVAVDETTNGVALSISTPVVQFPSSVTLGDVDLGEIANTGDLDVFRGLDEVDTLESAIWDGARAAARLGAVGDSQSLGVTDRSRVWRCPETEVACRVDPGCLALGGLASASATIVGAVLAILRDRG